MSSDTETQDLRTRLEDMERDQQNLMRAFETFANAVKQALTAVVDTQNNHTQALSHLRALLSALETKIGEPEEVSGVMKKGR